MIYIPKLASALKCTIYFNFSNCLIQGTLTLKTIRTSELSNGLYMLTYPTITINTNLSHCTYIVNDMINFNLCNNIVNTCDLWHNRIQHPSYETLTHINQLFTLNIQYKSSIICDNFFYLSKKYCLFTTTMTFQNPVLILFTWTFWGPFRYHICLVTNIFSLLLTTTTDSVEFFKMKFKYEASHFIQYAKT